MSIFTTPSLFGTAPWTRIRLGACLIVVAVTAPAWAIHLDAEDLPRKDITLQEGYVGELSGMQPQT